MKRLLNIFLLLFICPNFCGAQYQKLLDNFQNLANKASSDSDKVIALGKLADFYYTYKLNRQGDSVLRQQLLIADISNNNNLILMALFGDAINNISSSATKEDFDKTINYLEKGINYARSQNKYEYIALGYIRMAILLRNKGQYDKAINNAILATHQLTKIVSDSIKALVYIELGNTYQARGESVLAATNYNSAFDIAFKIKSVPLQSSIYHCYSEMYYALGNKDIAIDELKKSLILNTKHNYNEGLVKDHYDLARLTNEKYFIDKTLHLADSLKLIKYVLWAKELMFYVFMIIEMNSDKALHYLQTEQDLKQSYLNTGQEYYYRTIGQIYYYSNKPDSALYYYKLAEEGYIKVFDQKLIRGLYREIAATYKLLNKIPESINYYFKVLDISQLLNDANNIALTSKSLSELFEKQGDFKEAFNYSKQAIQYEDSLRKLSAGREMALLNVEREISKHAEEVRQEQQRINNKRNMQYMVITIAIALIFILILIIGMFPISKLTIRLLGYIFFISLFEFIVILIYTFVYKITHGEPLKIWLIKIVVIALLVPLQHFLEHKLIKFLESRKLLKARTKFSLRNWLHKRKTPAPLKKTKFEEGTAVL